MRRRSLESEINALHGRARRKRFALFGGAALLVVGGYYLAAQTGSDTSVNAATQQQSAVLRATGKRDDIKLVVDGKEIGNLPQDVKGLAPGEHSVAFEGGDRYAAQKSTVLLSANETKELELVSLRVIKGAATFDVKTPGTSLALVAADERRALTDYSHPIDIDTSKVWTLEASKPGFRTLSMPVNFDDQAEKTFVVALTDPSKNEAQKNEAIAAQADTASAKSEPKNEPKSEPKTAAQAPAPAAKTQPAAAPAAAPAKGGAGACTLNINSIPTSKITLDGRPLGLTPKVGVSVPPGTHSVMLLSDNGRKATSVVCKAGETKTVAVRITQ